MVDISLTGALVLSIVGIVFCALGLWLYEGVQKFRRDGIRTVGTVTDVKFVQKSNDEGFSSYRPTLDVRTPNGSVVSCQTAFSSSGYDFDRGEELEVLYLPGSDTVLVAKGAAGWVMPLGFLGMGGIALCIGLLALSGVSLPFGG